MFRPARAFLPILLTAALGLAAGCGEPTSLGGDYEPTEDAGERYMLTSVGEMLTYRALDTSKPPKGPADLASQEPVNSAAFKQVKSGDIVVVWGANPQQGADDKILAYQKATPDAGGLVLMLDGTTVKRMTAEEFQAAPRAVAGK
jgi:hypothetical protein